MQDTTTPTEYQQVFEAVLGKLLHEYVASHAEDGAKERAAFVARMDKSPAHDGAFCYRMPWDAADVITAETRSYAAQLIARALSPDEGEAQAPSAALAYAEERLQRLMDEALSGGRSTNPWHNLVVQEQGRAAQRLMGDYTDSVRGLRGRADWQARRTVAKDEYTVCDQAKGTVGVARNALSRARSERSIERLQGDVDAAEAAAQQAEQALQARLEAAGAPAPIPY